MDGKLVRETRRRIKVSRIRKSIRKREQDQQAPCDKNRSMTEEGPKQEVEEEEEAEEERANDKYE